MICKILVPLDGSVRAAAILPQVEELARCFGAGVVFVQVVEPIPMPITAQEAVITLQADETERRDKEAREYLAGLVDQFCASDIHARAVLMHGPVVEAIISAARNENVDLIAMASHGRTVLGQVFYGSVAAGVLHSVDCPLYLMRAGEVKEATPMEHEAPQTPLPV